MSLSASPASVVVGDPTTLTAVAVPLNGATAVTSYEWDCDSDGTIEATTTTGATTCTYATSGTKSARVNARSASAGGLGTTPITVTAAAPFFVGVVASKQNPAIGEPVTFTATVTSSRQIPTSFEWYWDDTSDQVVDAFTTGGSPTTRTIAFGSLGKNTFKVRAVDPITGREASGTQTVTVQ